jgi:hypothetical protein
MECILVNHEQGTYWYIFGTKKKRRGRGETNASAAPVI